MTWPRHHTTCPCAERPGQHRRHVGAVVVLAALLLLAGARAAQGANLEPIPDAPSAPPLSLPTPEKHQRALSDLAGSVVLVNFWASWCGPCITEIPSLRALQESMTGEPFQVLAVNVKESPFAVHKFRQLVEMPFPILLDEAGTAFEAWGGVVLPTSFLVDGRGRIRFRVHGPLDWASSDVIDTVRGLLPAAELP